LTPNNSKIFSKNKNSPSQNFLTENFTLPPREGDGTEFVETDLFSHAQRGRVMAPSLLKLSLLIIQKLILRLYKIKKLLKILPLKLT